MALASNNAFIINLVKVWLGGTPDVVVRTLKISLDQLFFPHNRTSNGKEMVTGVQLVTTSQVQIIGCIHVGGRPFHLEHG